MGLQELLSIKNNSAPAAPSPAPASSAPAAAATTSAPAARQGASTSSSSRSTSGSSSRSKSSSDSKSSSNSILSKYSDSFNSDNDTGDIGANFDSVMSKYSNIVNFRHDREGIEAMVHNERGSVTYGNGETVDIASAIADSFDSILDLYIQKEVHYCIQTYGGFTDDNGFIGDAAREYLKSKHIEVSGVGGGSIYAFSLVDDDGNIMQDDEGHLGSCMFADALTPDGEVDICEMDFALILDELGYDSVSRADFNGSDAEFEEMLAQIEQAVGAGEIDVSDQSILSVYGDVAVQHIYLNGHGHGHSGSGDKDGDSDLTNEASEKSKDKNKTSGQIDKELEKIYNQALKAKINNYKLDHNQTGITDIELSALESSVTSDILKDHKGFSLDDIKAVQKKVHKTIKTTDRNNTKAKEQDSETTASSLVDSKKDKKEKEEEKA